jgi:phospholipid/cholesterol/gamma-HCH transport system ATP-binding protein
VIRLKEVAQSFQQHVVFKNISFEVKKGQSLVVLGLSGSGKTVLLKSIAGLIPVINGSVDLSSKNVSMLFQRNALFDSFTVIDNLLFPLKERTNLVGSKAIERSMDLLSQVGLADSAHLYPREISGGMQKRLGIARALVVEPEIILFDEPTAGLDPITSRSISNLIRKMQQENKTTQVIVTNDIRRAYEMADEMGILAEGTFLPPSHPEFKRFVRGGNEH